MRVLVLIHEYPPVGGGGGRVAQDICQGLAQRGHELQVITAHWGGLPFQEQQGAVTIHRLASGRRLPYGASFATMARYVYESFRFGQKLIRNWKPDVLHAHFAVPAGAAVWALGRLTGIPYLLTAHLGDVPGGVPEKTERWFRWIFPLTPPIWRRAARVVAVSDYTRQLAARCYPVAVEVVPNGVDLEALNPGQIRLNDPPRILFAGRFMEQKNPLLLVQTLAGLQDLPWQCVLIGDGPLRGEVEREIARHGLGARFTLPGWVSPQVVLEWYAGGDLFFMPSLSEGLPVVGVQAMAMGLALVLSRVGGCVDLIEPGQNGYLVESGDRAGFESALRALLSDRHKLLAFRQASRRLAARYDLNSVVESYEQILAGVGRGIKKA